MAPPILALKGISAGFGNPILFENLDVYVGQGDRIALVGRNGSGKSTLLKIFAGLQQPDGGKKFVQPGTRTAYLGQDADLSGFETIGGYVESQISDPDSAVSYRVEAALSEVGMDPSAPTKGLSGGESRRVALAGVMVQDPDVLFLDEPTNHLDIKAIEWLEERLGYFTGAIITVSHDRAFLKRLSSVTLWLERGKIHRLEKGYEHFDAWSETLLALEAEDTAKLDKLIADETRWSREGISARRTRNQGRLRRLYSLRDDRQSRIGVRNMAVLESEQSKTSGKLVMEATDISKAYGDLTLINGFSTRIMRGDRVGIIGPNGAGKTTLLKMLTGELKPDAGTIKLGTNLDILTFDQTRSYLDPEATLWDTLADAGGDQINVRGRPKHVVGYLKEFLFHAGQARSPIKSLSGGEKNRLLLAKHLAKPSNMMILDEPTNDLDLETLDLLQEMLAEYEGTILLVSHDRDFLDRVVTSTIVLEGDGQVEEYPGGYSDYRDQRKAADKAIAAEKNNQSGGTGKNKAKKKSGRLSFNDKRELEQLPDGIKSMEVEISKLSNALSSAGSNSDKVRSLSDQLSQLTSELAIAEDRWLELEALREKLEG